MQEIDIDYKSNVVPAAPIRKPQLVYTTRSPEVAYITTLVIDLWLGASQNKQKQLGWIIFENTQKRDF